MLQEQEIKQLLSPKLELFEVERQKIAQNRRFVFLIFILLVGAIGGLIYSNITFVLESVKDTKTAFGVVTIVVVLIVILINYYVEERREGLERNIKIACYQQVLESWNPSITYHPQHKIPQNFVAESKMVTNYNESNGSNYCKGILEDNRSFQFSELELNKVTQSDGGERRENIFKGLFLVLEDVEFFDDNQGQIIFSSTKLPKIQKGNRKNKWINDSILDANLASTEVIPNIGSLDQFTELYTIGSNVRTDLKSMIKEDFFKELNHLTDFMKCPIRISFLQGKMYAMFWSAPGFLRVTIKDPLNNDKQLAKYTADFQLMFNFIDCLIRATQRSNLKL